MAYEFGSLAWLNTLGGLVLRNIGRAQALSIAKVSPLNFSMCEVFLDPPDHLGGKGTRIAWHCVVKDGHTRFETSEIDDAAFKIVADYQTILSIVRIDTDATPDGLARMIELGQAAMAAGKMSVIGSRANSDGQVSVESAHNEISRLTL